MNENSRAKTTNAERLAKEELSYDLKLLEDALQSYQNEDQEKFERKVSRNFKFSYHPFF